MWSCSPNDKINAKVCSNIIVAYLAIIIITDKYFGLKLLIFPTIILIYLKIFFILIKIVEYDLSLKIFIIVIVV